MWQNLLLSFFANLLIALLTPKPKLPQATKYQLKDFNVPTATEDRSLPWGVGTFQINSNVIWYGDLQEEEVSKRVRVSLIKKVKQVVGYRYRIGLWLSCNALPVDSLTEIRYGEDLVWKGTSLLSKTATTDVPVNFTTKDTPEDPVERGIVGVFRFYNQRVSENIDPTPLDNSYMAARLGRSSVPGYPNTTHAVFMGPSSGVGGSSAGFVSNNNQVQPITFTFFRLPSLTHIQTAGVNISYPVSGNTLDTGVSSAYYTHLANTQSISGDANPAYILLELLTTRVAGVGPKLSPHAIDVSSFLRAGQTLFSEGLGMSFSWETSKPVSELIQDLLGVMRAELQINERTGQVELSLLRATDPIKLVFNDSNIVAIKSFSRANLEEAPNQVVIPFIDRAAGWIERSFSKMNEAGVRAAGTVISKEVQFLGVSRPEVATYLCNRESASVATSVARASFDGILPEGMVLRPGDRISFLHSELGQTLAMRIVSARFASYDSRRKVEVEAVEDVLRDGRVSSYLALPPSVLQVSTLPAQPKGFGFVGITPYYFHQDESDHLMYYCLRSDTAPASQSTYDLALWSATPTTGETAEYLDEKQEFAALATLNSQPVSTAAEQTLTATVSLGAAYTIFSNNGLETIGMLGQEYVALTATVASATATTATIKLTRRGLFGTMPPTLATTRLLILYGYHIDPTAMPLDANGINLESRYGKPELYGKGGTRSVDAVSVNESDPEQWKWKVPAGEYSFQTQVGRPYPVADVEYNGVAGSTSSSSPTPVATLAGTIEWKPRNRLKLGYSDYFAGDGSAEQGTQYLVFLSYYKPSTMEWLPVKHDHDGSAVSGTSLTIHNPHDYPNTGNVLVKLQVRTLVPSGAYSDNDYDLFFQLQQP